MARQPVDGAVARADNLTLAIATIVFTVFALSLGDALVKELSADFPLWQIFVLRSVVTVPALAAAISLRYGIGALVPRRPAWAALRSVMLTLMWVSYYAALPHVALSTAAAVYYTLPLFITLFAGLLIGERVGPSGWIAVTVGFTGVLLILRPRAEAFNAWAILPLVSAILYALAMIMTRTKCRDEDPLVLSFALNLAFIAVGVAGTAGAWLWQPAPGEAAAGFLLGGWMPMAGEAWLAMAFMGVMVVIGSVGAAIAYQSGPSSVVATFDFAYLAFAAVWGLVLFGEVPDAPSAAGIVLIAAGGIVAVRRS